MTEKLSVHLSKSSLIVENLYFMDLAGNHDIPCLGKKKIRNTLKKKRIPNLGHITAHCFLFLYCLVHAKQLCELKIISQSFSLYKRNTYIYICPPLSTESCFSTFLSISKIFLLDKDDTSPSPPLFSWLLPTFFCFTCSLIAFFPLFQSRETMV